MKIKEPLCRGCGRRPDEADENGDGCYEPSCEFFSSEAQEVMDECKKWEESVLGALRAAGEPV